MKILVIGGSGFIGTRLIAELLSNGHQVTNFDTTRSAGYPDLTTIGDICDLDGLQDVVPGHEVVINLAAEHRDDVRPITRYEQVNVGGTRNVIAAATAHAVQRIIFTSSVAVYGLDKVNPNEDSAVEPFNEYGRTKYAAEGLLQQWCALDSERSLTVVRPSVVFGEGNRGNVYNLTRQIAGGRFVFVGKGANRKSMAYVGNIARFLACQVAAAPGATLTNFADKPDLTTRELVDLIRQVLEGKARKHLSVPLWMGRCAGFGFDLLARVMRKNLPISSIRVKKFAAETTIDTTRLLESGFIPPFSLVEALKRTVTAEFIDRDGLSAPIADSAGSE